MMTSGITPNLPLQTDQLPLSRLSKGTAFKELLEKGGKVSGEQKKKLREKVDEFVSIFVFQVLQSARKTVPKNGLIKRSQGEDVFTSMLDQEYSKQLVKQNDMDLARNMYAQLARRLS